jgi:hypothetical protein
MKKYLAPVLMFLVCLFIPALLAQAECLIQEDEEYAVMAAVLFPNEPDIPENITDELSRKVYRDRASVRLSGFHGSSYTLEDETTASKMTGEADPFTVIDYNRKNEQACRIDGARFLARIPPEKKTRVSVISAEEVRKLFSAGSGKGGGWREFRKKYPFAGGIVYFSRPGFNEARDRAVIEANCQADYEMGIGYRIHLEKSPKTGKWVMVNGDISRKS